MPLDDCLQRLRSRHSGNMVATELFSFINHLSLHIFCTVFLLLGQTSVSPLGFVTVLYFTLVFLFLSFCELCFLLREDALLCAVDVPSFLEFNKHFFVLHPPASLISLHLGLSLHREAWQLHCKKILLKYYHNTSKWYSCVKVLWISFSTILFLQFGSFQKYSTTGSASLLYLICF